MARHETRSAGDIIVGRDLAIAYCDLAADIEREAAEPKLRNMPLTVRKIRQYAAIARRAALSERDDPDINDDDRECRICGRVRSCLST
jgi:hypothetical protein